MDPEKPPRRKKSGETPVTIDLEAAPAVESGNTDEFEAASAEPTVETKPDTDVTPKSDTGTASVAETGTAEYYGRNLQSADDHLYRYHDDNGGYDDCGWYP